MTQTLFSGVIPPIPTIFDATGKFDPAGMGRLLDRLIERGVNGVLALGSAGEFCHMTQAMREEVAEFVVHHVNGRIPVILGVGAPGTQETIHYARHASKCGADAGMVINPYYAPLSQDNLYQHYRQIALSVELPLFLYNYPAMTGQDLEVDLVKKLAFDFKNFVGIKESVLSVSHTRQIIVDVKSPRPDFMVFCGYDEHLLNTLALGGDGAIPACANFAPEVVCGLYKAFRDKDYEKAFALHRTVAKLSPIYGIDTPFYGVIKEAIRQSGLDISTAVLAPTRALSDAGAQQVAEILRLAR